MSTPWSVFLNTAQTEEYKDLSTLYNTILESCSKLLDVIKVARVLHPVSDFLGCGYVSFMFVSL